MGARMQTIESGECSELLHNAGAGLGSARSYLEWIDDDRARLAIAKLGEVSRLIEEMKRDDPDPYEDCRRGPT